MARTEGMLEFEGALRHRWPGVRPAMPERNATTTSIRQTGQIDSKLKTNETIPIAQQRIDPFVLRKVFDRRAAAGRSYLICISVYIWRYR